MHREWRSIGIWLGNEYVVMPNHLHGIIVILDNDVCRGDPCGRPDQRAGTRPAPTKKQINIVRQYIINNPDNWETDRNNPKNFKN